MKNKETEDIENQLKKFRENGFQYLSENDKNIDFEKLAPKKLEKNILTNPKRSKN